MKPITIDLDKLPKTWSPGWLDVSPAVEVTYTLTVTVPPGTQFTARKMVAALRRAARDLEARRPSRKGK